MSYKIPFEDDDKIVRDSYSGAILSKNMNEVIAYKNKKNEIHRMRSMDSKIVVLENELKDIKLMLQQLINGKN